MAKHIVVQDLGNIYRIHEIIDLMAFKGRKDCYIDPDLKDVRTTPSHYWKLHPEIPNKFIPMTPAERKIRDADHAVRGVQAFRPEHHGKNVAHYGHNLRKKLAISLFVGIAIGIAALYASLRYAIFHL
jgi:hypothetical protein